MKRNFLVGILDGVIAVYRRIGSALLLAFLTAITTLLLAVVLSVVFGGENRTLFEQAVVNGEEVFDHAKTARCDLAYTVAILKEIGEQTEHLDLSKYDDLNTDGLDCHYILTHPIAPGIQSEGSHAAP